MTTEAEANPRNLDEVLRFYGNGLDAHEKRLAALEAFRARVEWPIQNMAEQMRAVVESQKADESDVYEELRRIIKVIALTEIIVQWGPPEQAEPRWGALCAELFYRWGHLTVGGKHLWTKPPTVSDATKQMIAEALKRRQEA